MNLQRYIKTISNKHLPNPRRFIIMLTLAAGLVALTYLALLQLNPGLLEDTEKKIYAHLHARASARAQLEYTPEQSLIEEEKEFAAEDTVSQKNNEVALTDLSAEQAATAFWLGKRYKVAPSALAKLIIQVYESGEYHGLDPALILSVTAVESSFNPYAESSAGAQGLMQVMTNVHKDKYANFGGVQAAFDPASNVQVGTLVLKDCIKRFGSVNSGLRCYVGAGNLPSDGGYAAKVLAVHHQLQSVMQKPAKFIPNALMQKIKMRQSIPSTEQGLLVAQN